MSEALRIYVLDDETLIIHDIAMADQNDIHEKVSKAFQDNPDIDFLIHPEEENFYKGIRKAIVAITKVQLNLSKVFYQPDDGPQVPIMELQSRQSQSQ